MVKHTNIFPRAENGASGIVPSAAEMWAMAQQILNRSANGTENSRTGNSNATHLERPQSSSSEVELTSNKAGLKQGITKTMAWETSTAAHQDNWSNTSEHERMSQDEFRSANMASVKSQASHQ
jgi:hypothetical protein